MVATRSWFTKLQKSKDTLSSSKKKQKEMDTARDRQKPPLVEAPSDITKQKVAAAKQYIENHYRMQMKSLQERKERRYILERKLADAVVSVDEQNNLIKNFEKKQNTCVSRGVKWESMILNG